MTCPDSTEGNRRDWEELEFILHEVALGESNTREGTLGKLEHTAALIISIATAVGS